MRSQICNVCRMELTDTLYRSHSGSVLTSLCQLRKEDLTVYVCRNCGHVQSNPIQGLADYYDRDYDILVRSVEEDQLYQPENGRAVFRTAHQLETIKKKLTLPPATRLLDYGCAKASTIRLLCEERPDIVPYVFDVSDQYLPFWSMFVAPDNLAVHATKPEWRSKFDLVTSFFSLEHIPRLQETMEHIVDLLVPGGIFYAVVPNVLSNIADLIVVDHCNHFTALSLMRLISDAGLTLTGLDDKAHQGAFIVTAEKKVTDQPVWAALDTSEKSLLLRKVKEAADFWDAAANRIRVHEEQLPDAEPIAIYGAGFYGAFVAASLAKPERIVCHLDQNPYLQGKSFNGREVRSPANLPIEVSSIFVGLNPARAESIILSTPLAVVERKLKYFYL